MEEYYGSYNSHDYQQPMQQRNKWTKLIIVALCAIAAIVAVFIVLPSASKHAGTTMLDISVSDSSAQVSIAQAGHQTQNPGTGNQQVRVDPGTYTVTAKTTNATTSKIVNVVKDGNNSVTLNLTPTKNASALAEYTARSIMVSGRTLKFLNVPMRVLNSFTPGDYRTQNIADATAYPLVDAFWLNDHQAYVQNVSRQWYLVNNNDAILVPNISALSMPQVAFNHSGDIAFINKRSQLAYMSSYNTQPQILEDNVSDDSQVALAPNGDIIIYTPKQSYNVTLKPTEIFKQGTTSPVKLSDSMEGINNVAWSPDSSSFSYTTSSGVFVYTANGSSIQASTVMPDHIASLTWIDNSNFMYVNGGAVWTFDTAQQATSQLSTLTGDFDPAASFYVDPTSKTAYYGTIPNGGQGGNIYSLPLQ